MKSVKSKSKFPQNLNLLQAILVTCVLYLCIESCSFLLTVIAEKKLGLAKEQLDQARLQESVVRLFCTSALIYLVVKRIMYHNIIDYLGLKMPAPKHILLMLSVVLWDILSKGSIVNMAKFFLGPGTNKHSEYFTQSGNTLSTWLATAFIVPIREELFFRGFTWRCLNNSGKNKHRAILISAFLFGIVHWVWSQYHALLFFIVGLFWGLLRAKSQSILPTIICHIVYNITALIYMFIL